MNLKTHKSTRTFFVLAIFFMAVVGVISLLNKTTVQQLSKNVEVLLQKKERVAEQKLQELSQLIKETNPDKQFEVLNSKFKDLYNEEQIMLCVYKNDTLCYWTANQPAIEILPFPQTNNAELIKIRNGWYESIVKTDSLKKGYSIAALIEIKHQYDVENKYIQNNFSDWLELPEKTNLKSDFTDSENAIKSIHGNSLFEIQREDAIYINETWELVASIIGLIAFMLLLYVLLNETIYRVKHKVKRLFVFSVLLLIIRTGMIYFKIPQLFYQTGLFDPLTFANGNSFYFAYLGDILLNSFLLLTAAIFTYKTNFLKHFKHTNQFYLALVIGIVLQIYFSESIRELIYSLVNNSTITYNVNDLFNLNGYTFVGLLSVGFMLYAFYIFTESLIIIVISKSKNWLLSFSITALVFLLMYLVLPSKTIDFFWMTPLVILSFVLRKYKASYNFINVGLIILVATILTSLLFNKYEIENKQKTYDALSFSLTDRQDVVAENEFIKVSASIKNDERLKNLLALLPVSSQQTEQNIRQTNFSGYFERYDIVLSLFSEDCLFAFPQEQQVYLNEDYFEEQIKQGSQTISDELFFIDKENSPIKYVAEVDLINRENKKFKLYVLMEPKNTSYLGAFPDLLLDKSLEKKRELKNTSYAIYYNNKLQQSFGEFQYPIFIKPDFEKSLDKTNYHHSVYNSRNSTKLIITNATLGFWQKLTSISYLFIFFTALVLLSIWFNNIVIRKESYFNSLNYRIQFILVTVVFLSLATVVTGTIWVVNSQFENKNKNELVSKSKLVLNEVQQFLSKTGQLEPDAQQGMTNLLKKLSQLFGSDISIFNNKGALYASSQSAIYDQGLISSYMNPIAFGTFSKEAIAGFSQRENIGNLNYLSAYTPLYNNSAELVGFINLPYFSKQKDLEADLTAYLTTLINIYTILFVVSTLVSLLLSNLLTKPLRMIKQQLSKIRFGRKNEAIAWNSNDEIGGLVSEYNSMLLKLDDSSKRLAQSERESAWREMAKQVAHEIKNPLTPMKLNIQHLQRVVATNPEDTTERVNKVADMLIEQIDTLSHIATEFSSFAKLPTTQLEKINLHDVLENVFQLFQQNSSCVITLNNNTELFIVADKEQCIRLFTNLLKNAEQAIPADRTGKIDINAFSQDEKIVVTIKDNGSGIPEEIKEKLFVPNFTTKSTGTGLGLSMVKNSVNAFNGTINFETEINKGTTFTLTFPRA